MEKKKSYRKDSMQLPLLNHDYAFGYYSSTISMVVGIVTGVGILHAKLKKWMAGLFKDEMENIEDKLDALNKQITIVDTETCKN